MPNDDRIDLSSLPMVALKDGQQIPNASAQLVAAFWSCVFVVRGYEHAGFTAHNARNRLQQRMDECQRAGLWDTKHYTYVAALYREAILSVYGARVRFDGQ